MKRVLLVLILIFIITGAMLSVKAVIIPAIVDAAVHRQDAKAGLYLWVKELSEKPQSYFTLENPDSYVLQAISNPGKSVFVGTKSNTQIDEEKSAHGGSMPANVEFNSHYYAINWAYATPNPIKEKVLITILNAGWIMWGTSIIATVIIRFSRKRSNKTTKVP
jgi:hypothetical protein